MNTRITPLLLLCCAVSTFAQGSLTPPGAPAATMKTLQEIEPRTPIGSLPFAISTPGSYYVTSNLISSLGGISISSDDVVIDLNGFTLTGAGSLTGIAVPAARRNILVRNGTLRNWGSGIEANAAVYSSFEQLQATANGTGIRVGEHCHVRRTIASSNSFVGIIASVASTISECYAAANGSEGLRAGSSSQILDSTASVNGTTGILVGDNCSVSRCHTSANSGDGLRVGNGSKIVDCTSVGNRGNGVSLNTICAIDDSVVKDNLLSGIVAGNGGHSVRNCVVEGNSQHGVRLGACCNIVAGCNIIQNDWDGIALASLCHVSGNVVHFNSLGTNNGAGIRLSGGDNRVEDNTIGNNDVGILTTVGSIGNFIIRNHARLNGTNYHFIATQNAGPIVGPGTITTNNPWANFSF